MKPALLIPVALALLTGTLASQKEAAPKQEVKPVPAAAPLVMAQAKCDLTLPVVGLTADNAAKSKATLEAMQVELFACAECKAEFAKAGDCPKCKKPLTASKMAVLGMVTTDVARGLIKVQTKEGMELQLSKLERTLRADALTIDDAKLMIPGHATLLVSGATTPEQAASIQAALIDAKLFQSVQAQATPAGVRIHVSAGTTPPTLARTREVVTKVMASFKLGDVIWNDWMVPAAG